MIERGTIAARVSAEQRGNRRAWPRHCLQLLVVGVLVASVVGTAGPASAFAAGNLTLVSSTDHGGPGGESEGGTASSDGTIVAFASWNKSLGEGDTDILSDIYVKNTITGALTLASTATNLAPGDTDSVNDIYVKNLTTGTVTLASDSDSGAKAPNAFASNTLSWFSPDGSKLVFSSAATNFGKGVTKNQFNTSFVYEKDLRTSAAAVDCAPSGGSAGLTARFSNLPPNKTFLLLTVTDGSGEGDASTIDGTPITTDPAGSASGPATLVPSNLLPVKVGYIVYRDYNANQQWNDQRDDAVYRGTATVTSCPSTVAASPE